MFETFAYHQYLQSPYDAIDQRLHEILQGTAHPGFLCPRPGDELLIDIYGFHEPVMAEAIKKLVADGVKIRMTCDHTQAMGTAERPMVEELALVLGAGNLVVGTSEQHAIDHDKQIILLHHGRPYMLVTGSYNFSLSAQQQNNAVNVFAGSHYQPLIAEAVQRFESHQKWILEHQPQYQPGPDGKLPSPAPRTHHA